jgi:predicted kinase
MPRVSLMEEMWHRCLHVGADVILDFGFWTRAERDRTRTCIIELGADFRLYRLACPDSVAWERIQARNAASDRGLYIAPNTFSVLKARFQPLDDDEARIEVSQSS